MRTQTTPTQFVQYEQGAGKVLTAIVNVDQSSVVNRNRDFETPVTSKLREIESRIKDETELEQYHRSVDAAFQFIKSYRPHAKTLVVFSQANGNVFSRELNVPLETEVCWQDLPHIRPLVEADDEFEQLLIVLIDRSHSRFLTSILGNVAELPEVRNAYPVAHTQAPGNDKTKSQATFHRKADERERYYLKEVAASVDAIATARSINKIVLAGHNGPSKELYFLLSKNVQKLVISFAVLPLEASHKDIASVILVAQERAERKFESLKVESLIDRAGASDKAVTGVRETMEALAEGRIHELVYAQGLSLKGARCLSCNNIVVNQTACPKCLAVFEPVDDAMDLIISAALDTGATVEQVRKEAAEKLLLAGGIGAILRY